MMQCATPIHTAELLRRLAEDSCLVHDDVVQNDFLDSDDDADDTSADFDSPLLDGYFESVSSDRELVENFFGRVCLLWKIMHTDSEHTRRASIQRRYRRRRDARIAPDQNIRTRLSFSPSFSP
ncbi:hypothetical protein PC118_g4373 [Phytophthora cactorum]|uniref:Uncharacterized protein n=1 Tax=Phytophthora cactorum TaxID=29920 RepID=A0A8T1GER8_9STRA|nr:hypothetical protein PC118_g4373 [Phytophthora cactorum]